MVSDNLKKYSLYAFVCVLFATFLLLLNSFIVVMGTPIQTLNMGVALESHVKGQNLSLPLPSVINVSTSQFDPNTQLYLDNFDKPLSEFHEVLKKNYKYEEGTYDCKYWSYVWTLYWKNKKDEYNWNMEYITTENHVLVMVSNETGYCTFDLDMVNCKGIEYVENEN